MDKLDEQTEEQLASLEERKQTKTQEIQDSNMSDEEKQEKLDELEGSTTDRKNRITEATQDQKSKYVESQVDQRQQAIEPAVTTALAPLTLLVGIPIALKKISDIITNASDTADLLNNRGIEGYEASKSNITETPASAGQLSQLEGSLSSAGFKGTYIGKKTLSDEREDNEDVLKVYSQEPIVEFKYDTAGDLINSINYISINDDEVTDDPEFQVNFIGSSPSDLQNKFTIRLTDISKTTAGIEIRTPDTEPNYDGILTVEVQGNKINRRRFRGDTTTRASNTFTIPVRFASTFGGEDPTTTTSTSNTSSTSTSSTSGTNTE